MALLTGSWAGPVVCWHPCVPGVLTHPQRHTRGPHLGSLETVTVGVFTARNAASQGLLFSRKLTLKHLPAHFLFVFYQQNKAFFHITETERRSMGMIP